MSETTLCPRCGAYWRCDCRFEEPRAIVRRRDPAPDIEAEAVACNHDWSETLGVDVDVDLAPEGARVFVCRLCGLYSVEAA